MKSSKPVDQNAAFEFVPVDPFIFGVSFNDVDVAFRGGVYAIRPSRSSTNPQTGFPTHGVYCIQKMEILDGDFAGEIRTKSYYLGSLAGSIPKNSPPRPLLVPSADNKVPVGGLTPEQIVALGIGQLAFEEADFPLYEGKFLLQPKDRSLPLRADQQYGMLVDSIKKLYPVSKNPTPDQIAYGTSFPPILAGNTGPDFALNYGFHMRLEGEEFKTLVAVSALGPIAPTAAATQAQTPAQVAADLASGVSTSASVGTNGSEYTVETVQTMIYKALMKGGPKMKNELITDLMNGATGNTDQLVTVLLSAGTWNSDLWAQGADTKYALK